MSNSAADGLPMPRRVPAIVAISLGTALSAIDGSIPNVALPTIARDLGIGASDAVLIVTVYQLVLVMSLLPLSALGDRVGHRRLYFTGMAIFAAASAISFFAANLPLLMAARTFQALGAAGVMSVSGAMIRTTYPAAQLGRGLGINSIVVTSAATLAPTLGGLIITIAPWPWIFIAATPIALIALIAGRALPTPIAHPAPYDMKGAALYAISFGMLIVGIESAVHGGSPVISTAIVALGVAIGIGFVRRELESSAPILPVDLIVRPAIALSLAAGQFAFIGSMILLLGLPFQLQHEYGFNPAQVGAMLAAWPLSMIVTAPLAGLLSDRFPAAILGGIGMSVAVVALLMLASLPAQPDPFAIAWRISLCGAAYGFFLAPNSRMILGSVPRERAAAAGGLVHTNRLTAQTLGATFTAVLLTHGLGEGSLPIFVAAGLATTAGLFSVARLAPRYRIAVEE